MNYVDSLKLMKKYSKCEQCGSEMVGNGEGTLEINGNTFYRTCKCGWSVLRGTSIKIKARASIGKLQIFECWEFDGNKRIDSKYVNVAHLKGKGVIKTVSQTKKAEEWLNTKEGLEFYKETPHTPII